VTLQPLAQQPAGSPIAACEWQRRLGDLLVETGDPAEARVAYHQALSATGCLGPREADARLALGDLEMAAGDRAAAVEVYAGTADPRARTNRGLALLALGRPQEAEH